MAARGTGLRAAVTMGRDPVFRRVMVPGVYRASFWAGIIRGESRRS